jgi:hypothetical protein
MSLDIHISDTNTSQSLPLMSSAEEGERFIRFAAGILITDPRLGINNHKWIVGFAEMLAIGESPTTPEAGLENF